MGSRKIPQKFFLRPTRVVARAMLGQVLCRQLPGGPLLRAKVVETEAYLGIKDRACHTFGGRRTPRTESMWGQGGHAYIYFIYGMHECFNAVTRGAGHPEAVLVRALEPLNGEEYLQSKLPHLRRTDWMKGPGRLCRAMGIDRSLNGSSLEGERLWFEFGEAPASSEIVATPRIGVSYAEEAAEWPLRFLIRDSAFVSGSKAMNQRRAGGKEPVSV